MRKKIVAGNWKMNKTLAEGSKLAEETLRLLSNEKIGDTVVVFCPPFTSLEKVSAIIKGKKNIYSAAQNSHLHIPQRKDVNRQHIMILLHLLH